MELFIGPGIIVAYLIIKAIFGSPIDAVLNRAEKTRKPPSEKECPFCLSKIPTQASKCKFCASTLKN